MAIRYVDVAAAGGGDGTSGTPWNTFLEAHSGSTDGDTIIVTTGTYSDATFFVHSKNLTWITDGGLVIYSTVTTAHTLFISGSVGASFTGITFSGNGDTSYLVTADASDTISFIDCVFNNTRATATDMVINGQGIAGNIQNWTFENCTLDIAAGSAFDIDGFHNVTINNCTITGEYKFIVLDSADTTGTVTFTNNTITGTTSDGRINIASTAAITEFICTNNTITTTAVSIGTMNQVVVEDVPIVNISNNIFNNETIPSSVAIREIRVDSPGGVDMAVIIDSNILKDRSLIDAGILVGADLSTAGDTKLNGAVISNNTLYQAAYYGEIPTQRHAIELGFSTGTITGNYVNGSFWHFVLKGGPVGVATDWTGSGGLYGNIAITGNYTAMANIKGISNVSLANNLFINLNAETLSTGMFYIIENNSEIGSIPQNISINNNIFYQEIGICNAIYVQQSTTVFTCDNNIYYSGNTSGFSNNLLGRVGSPYSTAATWIAEGYDTTYISEADPLFVDLINFELMEPSPAVSTGGRWWTGNNPVGFDSEPFSNIDTDIGAYQSTYGAFHPRNL